MGFATKTIQKVFFPGLKVPPRKNWSEAAETLGSVSRLSVSRRGLKIAALLVRPIGHVPQRDDVVAVLAHPISKKAKYFPLSTDRASQYLRAGIPVVVFDFNGFGESDRIDLFYWKDAAAVLDATKEEFPGRKIILHGMSFGAFHIVRSLPSLPPASTVILENVSRSLYDYWKRWALTRNAVRLLQALKLASIRDMEIKSILSGLQRPDLGVHFIACADDAYTPADEMQDLFALTTLQKEFYLLPNVEHLGAPEKHPERYSSILAGAMGKQA